MTHQSQLEVVDHMGRIVELLEKTGNLIGFYWQSSSEEIEKFHSYCSTRLQLREFDSQYRIVKPCLDCELMRATITSALLAYCYVSLNVRKQMRANRAYQLCIPVLIGSTALSLVRARNIYVDEK